MSQYYGQGHWFADIFIPIGIASLFFGGIGYFAFSIAGENEALRKTQNEKAVAVAKKEFPDKLIESTGCSRVGDSVKVMCTVRIWDDDSTSHLKLVGID